MKLLRPALEAGLLDALPSLPSINLEARPPTDLVHVAVGTSPEKTQRLLEWTFRRFRCREVVLIHVHRLSQTIPTLLGNLPANQANEQLVSAHRMVEWGNTKKMLLRYLDICYRSQVQPKIILVKAEHVQSGIVNVVNKYCIQKLVMGASPVYCLRAKPGSSKAIYTLKNVPSFCEIWFVKKGRLVWMREANEINFASTVSWTETLPGERKLERPEVRNLSHFNNPKESAFLIDSISQTASGVNLDNSTLSPISSSSTYFRDAKRSPSHTNSQEQLEALSGRLIGIIDEAKTAKEAASADLSKCMELKFASAKAFNMVKAFEAARLREIKFREELEALLVATKLQKDELINQKNKIVEELEGALSNVVILDDHYHQVVHLKDEVASELDKVLSSTANLELENQKIQHQKDEYARQIARLRCNNHVTSKICNKFIGFGNDSLDFKEFPLSDLHAATFGFSDTFKIGQGGHGCVYKGEMSNGSVAIKKFHHHSVQGQQEFQHEAFVLSKMRHPHLVTLIGACPEALSLVYEYLPNGTLHDRLIRKSMTPPLDWKARTRMIVELSGALLFLHSSKPEKIIHGDLKPLNIFLDSNFHCKVGGFGFCELVPEMVASGFRLLRQNSGPKSSFAEFPYSDPDPEYQRTNILTSKSDVYSFGIIVLQLLTGRPPLGLSTEVRRAVLSSRLSTVLDRNAGEWPKDVVGKLAEFGLKCTNMNSCKRPELTPTVVKELEQLYTMQERPIPSSFLCPILQEIMYDPEVAADGFTYEGKAIQEWIASGGETSPMTNLRLENLNLTPNHALRLAIQDWLSQPLQS
ncbi:U-box domain-containing protein 33 [Apostasia shenzhenica]|uniref:RING-type E3 ubiquitin transferase n=1 Tax=Apostasia shenzhenica TaxID=1088818 RepID=A0A2H9ZSG4_9ASPA|nr:U-box domain-containing protein 33 [Apostasia shenzhenica]